MVWQRLNARCAEYKWTIEVCKTKDRRKRRRALEFFAPYPTEKGTAMPPESVPSPAARLPN
ncbi:MAG: hypothetical protein ACRECN_08700, partial [Methylocella sp.]